MGKKDTLSLWRGEGIFLPEANHTQLKLCISPHSLKAPQGEIWDQSLRSIHRNKFA